MADIFISYARDDRESMERVANALAANGYAVWWDHNISGGAEFSRTIEKELMSATVVIVAWSATSVGSHWVRDEAEYARSTQKLLPISLDGTLPPLGFRQLHALDFAHWNGSDDENCFKQLLDSLGPPSGVPAGAEARRAEKSSPPPQADDREKPRKGTLPRDPVSRQASIGRPGIAVLPLVNMSTDREVEFLADGLTEDILTALSGNRHLAVAARTSSFAYKGRSVDIREIGQQLDARYIVEGSVRKMGNRCRVTVQLIDTGSGGHVWAKKFDEPLEALLTSPDEILEKIVGSLFTQLYAAEAERALHAPPESLGAWEYCQRAAISIGRGAGSLDNWQRAHDDLQKAVDLAPDYPLAHALLAWACNAAIINGLYEDKELQSFIDKARFHFVRARELAQDDLLSLTYIAGAENFAGQQERSLHHLQHVLRRNPASAEAWFLICMTYNYLGRFDEAREAIEKAESLAPEKGYSHQYDWTKGQIDFVQGNYEVAAVHFERKVRDEPGYGYGNVITALCNYYTGNEEAARKQIARAKEYNPQLYPEKMRAIIFGQPDKEKAAREYATVELLWSDALPVPPPREHSEAAAETVRAGAEKPGIAVMPLALRTTEQDIEFIADGLPEDIITSLSTNQHLRVAGRAATLAYKDQVVDAQQLGAELGVRYIVEGSIRKLGERLRISVQLIDAENGDTLWARNFDGTLDSIYGTYDDFVEKISASLFAQLISAETTRAQRLPEDQLGAWEYCMRSAIAAGQQSTDPQVFRENFAILERAVELKPDYSLAHAMLSWACNVMLVNGLYQDAELPEFLDKAKKHLRLARSLARDDLYTLVWIGASENFAGMQERSVATLERVLARNPSSADALMFICQAYAYLGRFDDARAAINRAKLIAPEAGMSNIHDWYLGLVEHLAGNYQLALPLVISETVAYPTYGYANMLAAIELAMSGRAEEAPRYIARALKHNPHLTPRKVALMMLAQPDKEKGREELAVLNRLWAEAVGQH